MLKFCVKVVLWTQQYWGWRGQQCVNLRPFSIIKNPKSYLLLKSLGLCFPSGTYYCWDQSTKIWAELVRIYHTVILFKLIFHQGSICCCSGTNNFVHPVLACLMLDPHLENFNISLIINRGQIWSLATMKESFNGECSQQSLWFSIKDREVLVAWAKAQVIHICTNINLR